VSHCRGTVIGVLVGTALLTHCVPQPFAERARAQVAAHLGPPDRYVARHDLAVFVEGDHALVTIFPVLRPDVGQVDGTEFPQAWVSRRGELKLVAGEGLGLATLQRTLTRGMVRDEASVRQVARSLLPPTARIYCVRRAPATREPVWTVFALTSPLSADLPRGLVVEVRDERVELVGRFPKEPTGQPAN
jgi:hypothetical protein